MRPRASALALLLLASAVIASLGACEGDLGTGGAGQGTQAVVTTGGPVTSGAEQGCDSIGVCEGDQVTPESGCLECAVLGSPTLAADGGACIDEYKECFGTAGSCDEGGHPGCCSFLDCLIGCPDDLVGTPGNEFLDCVCENDGVDCAGTQTHKTCLGKYPPGGARYIAWVSCVYQDVCATSCAE